MTHDERMQLAEKMRQAYLGYTPESAPKIARVFTVVNPNTDQIISKHFF